MHNMYPRYLCVRSITLYNILLYHIYVIASIAKNVLKLFRLYYFLKHQHLPGYASKNWIKKEWYSRRCRRKRQQHGRALHTPHQHYVWRHTAANLLGLRWPWLGDMRSRKFNYRNLFTSHLSLNLWIHWKQFCYWSINLKYLKASSLHRNQDRMTAW